MGENSRGVGKLLKRKIWIGVLLVFSCLFLAACSNDTSSSEQETVELEVSDEELFSILEANVETLMKKDLDGYMDTIHSDSPVYATTRETIQELFNYNLAIELSDLTVKEKSAEEAIVAYTQRTVELDGDAFENNETIGEHLLRLDDGNWKIYQSEVIAVNPLPQQEVEQEEAEMAGEYAAVMKELALPLPFDEEEWILASYEEYDGEATAEYIPGGENLGNYTRILTYHYYENGNESTELGHFVGVMEQSLDEMITGDFEFQRIQPVTETEVAYQFSVRDDETEPDQEEVGLIVVAEDDIYVFRYTVMQADMENEEEIVNLLREIK